MTIFESIFLGALQGITEFLPISSSGHLVIFESVFGLKVDALKSFDVAVHLGTLLAILIYFGKDICGMLKAFFGIFAGRFDTKNEFLRLIFYIVIGSIPAILIGLKYENYLDENFRNIHSVALVLGGGGLLFLLAEYANKKFKEKGELSIWKALFIGVFQSVALIPGVSRSGSSISAGLFSKLSRESSARFSFLLGIPAIFGAVVLTSINHSGEMVQSVNLLPIGVGFAASFVFGLISVSILMKFLKKHSLLVFAAYRFVVGFGIYFFL